MQLEGKCQDGSLLGGERKIDDVFCSSLGGLACTGGQMASALLHDPPASVCQEALGCVLQMPLKGNFS